MCFQPDDKGGGEGRVCVWRGEWLVIISCPRDFWKEDEEQGA